MITDNIELINKLAEIIGILTDTTDGEPNMTTDYVLRRYSK